MNAQMSKYLLKINIIIVHAIRHSKNITAESSIILKVSYFFKSGSILP